ncbi:MAG: phytanoyl-CoA dioxygenase family protein [Alphaproteobacteria bacterium]|nr:phytanoyl-CoA dioxygenase family protein [Alphaproteobacteria bacterium]
MSGEAALPVLHPLNRDFAWIDRGGMPLRRLTPAQRSQFNTEGFVLLPQVFSAQEIADVVREIDPLEARGEAWLREKGGQVSISTADVITFTTHLVCKSQLLRDFAAHQAIKEICHDLIGGTVRLYWDQSVYKKTGRPQEFPWHQDNGYTFIEPQQYLTLWIPLVNVDEENGCPWIAPGRHRQGTLAHWSTALGYKCLEQVDDAVAVPARAGDVIAFSSLAPHRTGPNLRIGTVRKAYILQYAPDGAFTVRDGVRAEQNDPERQFLILEDGGRQGA